MKIIVFSTLFGICSIATAQIPEALLEACNAVQDPAKRLECLKQATGRIAPSPLVSIVPSDEALRRAFIGLQGSLESGISLINYQAAVNDVAREMAIYEREAPKSASAGVLKLKEALDTYLDAARFWSEAISFYARRDNSQSYFGGLPVKQVSLEWMVTKHQLPTRNADLFGIYVGVPTDLGRQTMWTKARVLADDGLKYLRDPNAAAFELAALKAKNAPPQIIIFGITVAPIVGGGLEVLQTASEAPVGLKVGDIIIAVGGKKLFTLDDFQISMKGLTQSSTTDAVLLRGGVELSTELVFKR